MRHNHFSIKESVLGIFILVSIICLSSCNRRSAIILKKISNEYEHAVEHSGGSEEAQSMNTEERYQVEGIIKYGFGGRIVSFYDKSNVLVRKQQGTQVTYTLLLAGVVSCPATKNRETTIQETYYINADQDPWGIGDECHRDYDVSEFEFRSTNTLSTGETNTYYYSIVK